MRKELLKRVMVADRYKKRLAVLMSLALTATTFSAAPSSEAAAKTTPSLSAKKKTLYYNGTKKFTLKVKKNKAKKIVKTTWKTSNKKVAAISKKKKTSVVVTAKKEGSAKIIATVSYKAGSKTKKVKLTCKVTSKNKSENTDNTNTDGNTTPTKAPGGDTTPAPTQGGNVTPTPTQGGNATPTPTQGENATPTPTQGENATPTPTQGENATPTPTQGENATPTPTQGGNATPTPTQGGNATPTPTQGGNAIPTPAQGSIEAMEGCGDPFNAPTSMGYSLKEKNSTVTYYVEAFSEAHVLIVLNQEDKFINLNTEAHAWTSSDGVAENLTTNMEDPIDDQYIIDESIGNLQPGQKYTITVTRKDYENKDKADYEFIIKNTDTGSTYVDFTAKNTVLTGDVSSFLRVISGSIKMYSDTVPKPGQIPANGSLETVEGEWIRSMEYSMNEKNSTVTFYVETLSADAHVFIALNQGDKYFNLNTEAEAWVQPEGLAENIPTEPTKIDSSCIINEDFFNFQEGEKYTIIITRKDYENKDNADYEFVIKNTDTDATYVKFTAKNTTLTGDVSAYLNVVWGSIKMYSDTVPRQNHGTDRTRRYSLSEVNNEPPVNYQIPEGLVREAKDKAYEEYFPKDSIQTVKVEMDEINLNYMLQHAGDKPSVMTNSVTIGDGADAVKVEYVGIKTKGNYTLSVTNGSDSDRFSFTLNFGKYIKKKKGYTATQNFYGCRKISFNNCSFDKTIMKEYNAMRLMDEMGIPTPQYSLAKLYINNKYYGVYFMVEAMDSAIIERYKKVSSQEVSDYLVKPSYTHMSYGFEDDLEACVNENGEFTMDALSEAGLLFWQDEDQSYHAEETLWNYSGIWENEDDKLQDVAEMIPTVLTWNRKVQLLSDGKDFNGTEIDDVNSDEYLKLLESVMDTDEAVKYFATHSFLVQLDNMFTGGQNYGLYVGEDGKSLFVPWDYDFAWGTAIWNDGHITAEQSANWEIDKMYPGNFEVYDEDDTKTYDDMTKEEVYKRAPLFHVIWQNNKLKEKYYTYMEDCAKRVLLGGTLSDGTKVEPARFAKTIETYYSQVTEAARIEDLAENVYYVGGIEQPKGTQEGIPELKKLIARRAVSVWLQTHKIKTTVTGYDCDILKLGTNFVYDEDEDRPTVNETLAVVDEDTGIFATATYSDDNDEAWLKAQQVISGDDYTKISTKEGLTDPLVYKIELANANMLTTSEYKLYIPVSPGKENANIYAYSAETDSLQDLTAEITDNVYCVTGTGFTYIVVD